MKNNKYTKLINILSSGGTGDFLLGIRLKYLLNQLHPNFLVSNYLCCRKETWKMIKVLYPNDKNLVPSPETQLEQFKNKEELNLFQKDAENYRVYPDSLFRGFGSPPLKEWGISNFLIKQTRTLLGKWKPENYISLALNSITDGYTFHSIAELAYKLAAQFPDKIVYLPLISKWNNKDLPKYNFNNKPDNLLIDFEPEFSKVYDILCKSEFLISTDNAMYHIGGEIAIPQLLLDPQYNKYAFLSRWRPMGNYNSIPINSLVEDIVNIVDTQLKYPETQMLPSESVFRRNNINWPQTLIFKD